MDPVFELDLRLPASGSRRLLRELHGQLRTAILDGRLKPGLRLPSTRALADRLRVSRNTAVAAYDLLLSEGYVAARAGAGFHVSSVAKVPARLSPRQAEMALSSRLSAYAQMLVVGGIPAQEDRPEFDFALGMPDTRHFPFAVWSRLANRSIRNLARMPTRFGDAQGQPSLREAIARHVSFTRAVACEAASILVVNGAQQAFDLLARVLVVSGKTQVAVESPGYGPAQAAFAAAGGKIVPVPVDDEGLRVHKLGTATRIVSVSPSHQYPLGCVMSSSRRAALIAFARRHQAVIVEDDYDGEFRYDGRPLDALQTLDRSGSVFYVGTLSKSLFPALRVGFIVAPARALPALVAAKRQADRHSDVVTQETLAAFIAEGHLARHVRKMRRIYAERRQVLIDRIERDFAPWLELVPSAAGLHLAALARPGVSVERIVERARQADVGISPIPACAVSPDAPSGLLFGFGSLDVEAISEALTRLRRTMPAGK
jgi:GntR family transcriptional regulator / MocR family aminotransferase